MAKLLNYDALNALLESWINGNFPWVKGELKKLSCENRYRVITHFRGQVSEDEVFKLVEIIITKKFGG